MPESKPTIVVLDGFTLNPGDLDWSPLRVLGDCEIFDRTPLDQIVSRAVPAEMVLTNKTVLSRESIARLPRLRYIGVLATGTNIVDLAAARERGIPVTNVPAYGTRSVAQATFALLLELTNRVGHHSQAVHAGRWANNPEWCFWDGQLVELSGLTIGIVGLGRIGRAVAELAAAFGMIVIAHSPSAQSVPPGVTLVDLDQLFCESDVISLHCPLTPQTRQLVNPARLQLMRPTAFLLNTSRGGLVDEAALADALNSGRIAGAAVDVLSIEPPSSANPLLTARNCIITPHNAWATRAARSRLLQIAAANVRAFLTGRPENVVN
jgi:glycerate dehydrogenase